MDGSILNTIGEEVVGIICPVSICMLLVVILVRKLQTEVTNSVWSSIAVLVYSEDSTDSVWTKFFGAVLNAGMFIVIVTAVTFVLVLLFYFRCTKCLRIYMGVAAFTVLAYMGGSVGVLLIQNMSIPIDVITASIILYNVAIVGVLSVFFCKMPILFSQAYLVLVGMLVAFWFASLPEWTTWALLVAISLYDIVAVLTPVGPLNLLIQLAMTRDEEIPALIYEARPLTAAVHSSVPEITATDVPLLENLARPSGQQRRKWKRRTTISDERSSLVSDFISGSSVPLVAREEGQEGTFSPVQRLQNLDRLQKHDSLARAPRVAMQDIRSSAGHSVCDEVCTDSENSLANGMVSEEELESQSTVHGRRPSMNDGGALSGDAASVYSMASMDGTDTRLLIAEGQEMTRDTVDELDEGVGLGSSGAIKLGLGDFIFYSVLVGRAALYDMMTVYACYLAIITGLGATLALLAVWRRALPALPISIALGVVFYFLARFFMEPFVMQFGTDLIFF